MSSLIRTSEKKKAKKRIFSVCLVFGLIFVVAFPLRDRAAFFAHKVLTPINQTFHYLTKPFRKVGVYFNSKIYLEEQNKILSNENRNLKMETLSLMSLKRQNQELREILGARNDYNNYQKALARVLLVPPFSPFDTMVVNLSNSSDMDNWDPDYFLNREVFLRNILVGEVVERRDSNLIVELYSSYGRKIPVRIDNEIIAEAEGQGGLSFIINLPKDIDIYMDSPIFSMTHPDLILGTVSKIETTETGSFQTIWFQYPISYSDFTYVEIAY